MRLALLALAGCYGPMISTGSPCETTADCPTTQVCSPATLTCELTAMQPDAAVGDDDVAPNVDAMMVDAPPGSTCYGTGIFTACMLPPTTTLTVTTAITIDTSSCDLVVDGACVIAHREIVVEQTGSIDARGTLPLVLIGSVAIAIDGRIDAASHRGVKNGPGASTAPCTTVSSSQTAGGVGGSFGGVGGDGGDGDNGTGKDAAPAIGVAQLRAGCPGQRGGTPQPGLGGAGGGALLLVSSSIRVGGVIDASGAGGTGGSSTEDSGGGGGGSGGFIGIDAPSLAITGTLVANGGGGGEGSDNDNDPGNHGSDGGNTPVRAAGGSGGATDGGNGGAGSLGTALNGLGGLNGESGGGGGGGAAGIIRAYPTRAIAGTSPPAS